MFGPVQGKIDKLVQAGFPHRWARIFRALLGNPTQSLEHRGSVSIVLSAQTAKTPAASMADKPADAAKTAPALTIHNYGGDSLFVGSGNSTINGDSHTINAPLTTNNYGYHNYPQHFLDDIRMMGELIFKYGVVGRASTIARVKFVSNFSGGIAQAIVIDESGNPYGQILTVHAPPGSSGNMNTCSSGIGQTGKIAYFSDYATGGPLADTAVRPNIGAWELLSLDPPSSNYNQCHWEAVVKVCCVNNKLIVCTQTIDFSTPVKLGVVDCGGSVTCT